MRSIYLAVLCSVAFVTGFAGVQAWLTSYLRSEFALLGIAFPPQNVSMELPSSLMRAIAWHALMAKFRIPLLVLCVVIPFVILAFGRWCYQADNQRLTP